MVVTSFSSFHDLMQLFDRAFQSLNISVPRSKIERISSRIYQSMSSRDRRYHVLEHVFQMANGAGPLESLAIAFHDVVYVNVDRRIHPLLRPYLSEFHLEDDYSIELPDSEEDPILGLVFKIFGMTPRQRLIPTAGANEVLSAVAAARLLKEYLDPWQLIQVVSCIEATIPFRSRNRDGHTPSELLAIRLKALVQHRDLKITDEQIDEAVKKSVDVANRDVVGFFSRDLGLFLGQSWTLILEGNPIFRNRLYTVKRYRMALQKMCTFFRSLSTENVLRTYRNYPDVLQLSEMSSQTKSNLSNAAYYIEIKLVSVGILEAIAALTGGTAPMTLFNGELPYEGKDSGEALEKFLDFRIPVANDGRNWIAVDILKFGRSSASSFDFKQSLLSAFIYERMDTKIFNRAIEFAHSYFQGEVDAIEYLCSFPPLILNSVIHAVSHVAWSRQEEVCLLQKKIESRRSKAA